MKKDIQIPKVTNVYLAVVHDFNETFKTNDWNVYLVNDKEIPLEMVMIISKGYDANRETAQMRHKVPILPSKSGIKVEFMQDEVLQLNNVFKIIFFAGNTLFDTTFFVKKNSIKKSAFRMIKALNKRGMLIKPTLPEFK